MLIFLKKSICFFISTTAILAHSETVVCLKSERTKNERVIYLQLNLDFNEGIGTASYRGHADSLRIQLISEKSISPRLSPPPVAVESVWEESTDGKKNGRYVLVSRGPSIQRLTYRSNKGRILNFHDDQESSLPGRCVWNDFDLGLK
jgi:hypothetical protein